jgi:ABC-type nitrate/sulfonate/bicarbonate transport system substrate-binding protein
LWSLKKSLFKDSHCPPLEKQMRKRLLISILLTLIFLPCGYSFAQNKKIRVAMPGLTVTSAPFLTSQLNGYYTHEGLDAELISMRAPTANLAVLAGNVEFSNVPMVGLNAALRGAPLKLIFCPFDKPQHGIYARPEIQNIKQLRGKKIAVSGTGVIDDLLLREFLSGHGLERDVTILAMGSAETRLAGLASGTIDAATLIAPLTFKAKDMGLKELVFFGDQSFLLPGGAILVRDDLLRADPGTIERFIRASLMGFRFLRENPAAPKIIARTLKVDESMGTKMYEAARPTMTTGADLSDDAQKKMIALVMKLTGIKDGPPVERLFDFSLLRKAHATLQARGWKPL